MESKELAFEAGRLLLSTRAHTQEEDVERLFNLRGKLETSDEAVVMEKVENYMIYFVRDCVHMTAHHFSSKLTAMTCHLDIPEILRWMPAPLD